MKLENILAKAKAEAKKLDMDWLKNAKEIAVKRRGGFEKLDRLDLRELGGSAEDPEVVEVKWLSEPRSVKTAKMMSAMDVVEVEVLRSSKPDLAEAGKKYSVWANTTVLKQELDRNKPVAGEKAIIASYGTIQNKRGQNMYLFRVIPEG